MNKRKTRPSSTTSSSSKKSLTVSTTDNTNFDRKSSKSEILSGGSTSNSVENNLQTQSGDNGPHTPVLNGRTPGTSTLCGLTESGMSESQKNLSQRVLSSQSDNNLRKSVTSVAQSSTTSKERKTRPDRISLRNFISRTFFSPSSSASSLPPSSGSNSSTTKARSNSSQSRKAERKASSVSSRSSPNNLQVLREMPQSTVAIVSFAASLGETSQEEVGSKCCGICYGFFPASEFPVLDKNMRCRHAACRLCYRQYLTVQITESRVDLTCPECDAPLHPNDVQAVLNDPVMLQKYEQFMIRRVLAFDVDTRWCPAPDCGYAVIAAGCAECPRLVCEREECGTAFCYHCAGMWHPVSTCDEARAQRFGLNMATAAAVGAVTFRRVAGNALFSAAPSSLLGKIKPCPRCKALIAKMDDGSCNHMTCTICGADFCWLCMKEISDLHFLSPTGCTFWGKKPWSRKKKLICQIGTLIGAPIGIALVAGVAVPSMIIGIPIWVGRKIHRKMIFSKRYKRNMAVASGVTGAVLIAPAVATLVVGFGVPLMLAYVYGVVPFSLCRNGGTCRNASQSHNSVANSTSNLSTDIDAVIPPGGDDEVSTSGLTHLRHSSMAGDGSSLDIVTQQLHGHGSKSPDEQLMLRMMMVLDENDVVFVNQDTKSVTEVSSARIRHRAEINHNNNQIQDQTASIGEFSMDSCDAHSQKKLIIMDPSGHSSIADGDAVRLTDERDDAVARLRINEEDRPNFDSASTLAFHLSARRQSMSSDSFNYSLADRLTLETTSTDLDYLEATEDDASTKALAGSILGKREVSRKIGAASMEKSPSSHSGAAMGDAESVKSAVEA